MLGRFPHRGGQTSRAGRSLYQNKLNGPCHTDAIGRHANGRGHLIGPTKAIEAMERGDGSMETDKCPEESKQLVILDMHDLIPGFPLA